MYKVIDAEDRRVVATFEDAQQAIDYAERQSRGTLRWERRPGTAELHGTAIPHNVLSDNGVVVHRADASF